MRIYAPGLGDRADIQTVNTTAAHRRKSGGKSGIPLIAKDTIEAAA